jgi:Rrf2 family transcriptional regulator, nitric oxide-sensitive transcriptional repressor
MKLQIASRIAIYAVLELAAKPDEQVSVAEIGEKYRISSHHLAKVMKVLGREGLVRSMRGAGGGSQFSGNARRVTLLDIIELFENFGSEDDEAGKPGTATDEGRVLRHILDEIDDISRATFGSITIATMLKILERQRKNARRG